MFAPLIVNVDVLLSACKRTWTE